MRDATRDVGDKSTLGRDGGENRKRRAAKRRRWKCSQAPGNAWTTRRTFRGVYPTVTLIAGHHHHRRRHFRFSLRKKIHSRYWQHLPPARYLTKQTGTRDQNRATLGIIRARGSSQPCPRQRRNRRQLRRAKVSHATLHASFPPSS